MAIIAMWQLKCKRAKYSSDCEAQSMATKQQRASTSSSDSSVADKKKRGQVSVATFKQWQTEYEKEYQSLSWLCCTTDERDYYVQPNIKNDSTIFSLE